MFITSKNKYISNDMKIFGTCSIPLTSHLLRFHIRFGTMSRNSNPIIFSFFFFFSLSDKFYYNFIFDALNVPYNNMVCTTVWWLNIGLVLIVRTTSYLHYIKSTQYPCRSNQNPHTDATISDKHVYFILLL